MAFSVKAWWNGVTGQLISGTTLNDLEDRINTAISAIPTTGGTTGPTNAVTSDDIQNIVTSTDANEPLNNGDLLLVFSPDLPTYFTNFSDSTAGSAPTGWTIRWTTTDWTVIADSSGTGGKVLRTTGSGGATGRRAISWDLIDADVNRANVEIVYKWRFSSVSGHVSNRAFARASGTSGSEVGVGGGHTTNANDSILIYPANTFTDVSVASYLADTWYITRFRVNGTTAQARTWRSTVAEPSTWTVTTTGLSNTSAGWVGLFTQTTSDPDSRDFDWIGVATNGLTAPMS